MSSDASKRVVRAAMATVLLVLAGRELLAGGVSLPMAVTGVVGVLLLLGAITGKG